MSDLPPPGPLTRLLRPVEDLDRARAFWGGGLGLAEVESAPGRAVFDLGGLRLELHEVGARMPADELHLATARIQDHWAQLSDRGVSFTGAPHLVRLHPDGREDWIAHFTDDEGRPLALVSPGAPVDGAA